MSALVLLDAGPLGIISNPFSSAQNIACVRWLASFTLSGENKVFVPEIADYEVRRELLRARKTTGIQRLDTFKTKLGYLPIKTSTMLLAARLWAEARQQGIPTADPKALDCDVILAAQALEIGGIVATANDVHLSRFVETLNWNSILSE